MRGSISSFDTRFVCMAVRIINLNRKLFGLEFAFVISAHYKILSIGKLVVLSREGCLHDNTWHSVAVHRKRRRVTLDVDKQKRITAVIPGQFSFLDFKGGEELILFGGGPDVATLDQSESKKNFSGIIQQLQFDEYQVLDEV